MISDDNQLFLLQKKPVGLKNLKLIADVCGVELEVTDMKNKNQNGLDTKDLSAFCCYDQERHDVLGNASHERF